MINWLKKLIMKETKPAFPLNPQNSKIPTDTDSIMAVNTMTKKSKNQDAFYISEDNRIMAIADGVGSHLYSEIGSDFVVKKIVELIIENNNHYNIDFLELFTRTQKLLTEHIKKNFKDELVKFEKQGCFGTTLIVAIDLPDKFVIAYLGNGCIWHLRGNYTELTNNIYLPWHSVNLLNPHTIQIEGKEALYKIFAYENDNQNVIPTVIELSKDNELFGDILMIGTDGIFSNDQTIPGKDGEDNIWIPSSKIMEIFYKQLNSFLSSEVPHSNDKTRLMLHNFLTTVKENNFMDDDTTIGLFISQPCLKYNIKKMDQNKSAK